MLAGDDANVDVGGGVEVDTLCVSITIVSDSIKSWIAFRKVK